MNGPTPFVDPNKYRAGGDWTTDTSGVTTVPSKNGNKKAISTVPLVPQGDYELDVSFVRLSGKNDVIVFIPAGSYYTTLQYGSGATRNGDVISKKDRLNNVTTPTAVMTGKEYKVGVVVRFLDNAVQIDTTLNGAPCLRYSGRVADLGSTWVSPHPDAFGLGAYDCKVHFSLVRFRMLSGMALMAKE